MRSGTLASIMADDALAAEMVPWACPCDFGPDGRYRLEELISGGPRALVYRATDKRLSSQGFEARVAVKVFRPGVAFHDEALATRRISHANVLGIIDRGLEGGETPYMVAEFVDGGDLSDRPGPWKARDAAAFMAKVASGVQAAHSAGIIHCDLKPANILLTKTGDPKLADFELSRWAERDEGGSRGNAAFMSPEQFRGDADGLTPPSDVYALGGLLYWLLTGELPNGSTPAEVASVHSHRKEAPSPQVERDLDRICMRAMAPDRADRYFSAGDLAADLEKWTRLEPLPWTGPVRRVWLGARRAPVRSALAAVGAVTLLATAFVWQYSAAQKLKAQADSIRMADQRIEEIKAKARAQIEFFSKTIWSDKPGDLQDRVLPMLVWLNWLADSPVIASDGAVPTVSERVNLLRPMVASSEGDERRGQMEDLLARYSLAYFLTDQGESVEPRTLLKEARGMWEKRLGPDDPFWVSVSGIEACAKFNEARARAGHGAGGDDMAAAIASLRKTVEDLGRDGRAEPVRRLGERLLERATKKPGKGGGAAQGNAG